MNIELFFHLLKSFFKNSEYKPKDVVFLAFNDKFGERLKKLASKLSDKGLSIECYSMCYDDFFKRGFVKLSLSSINRFILGPILNYIIKTHNPKIIIFQYDMLKKEIYEYLKNHQITVVNIAHGITGRSFLFNSLNYDYYFIFGKQSLENMIRNDHLKGQTKVLLGGSPYFELNNFNTNDVNRNYITIAGNYFHHSFPKDLYYFYVRNFYEPISKLIDIYSNYKFIYKPHFIRDKELEEKFFLKKPNCELVNDSSIINVLKKSKLVICDFSTVSIEAASLSVPFIILDWQYEKNKSYYISDELGDLKFFSRATNFETLNYLFQQRLNCTNEILDKLQRYYRSHINRDDSINYISEMIFHIFNENNEILEKEIIMLNKC